MTTLAVSQVRRNKLVSCFSNLILLPMEHSLRLLYSWKSCPCAMCVLSNSAASLSKKKKGWTDSGTMTVALYCTNVSNRSVLILAILHSGNVGRTTGCFNRIFFVSIVQFAQHLPCVSKHVTIVLPRRIDDNLQVLEPSPSAWTFRTSRLFKARHQAPM